MRGRRAGYGDKRKKGQAGGREEGGLGGGMRGKRAGLGDEGKEGW